MREREGSGEREYTERERERERERTHRERERERERENSELRERERERERLTTSLLRRSHQGTALIILGGTVGGAQRECSHSKAKVTTIERALLPSHLREGRPLRSPLGLALALRLLRRQNSSVQTLLQKSFKCQSSGAV